MGRNLERLVQKAKAERPKPAILPANALPIIAQTEVGLAERIDGLIAAGKLAEVDRARCVIWHKFLSGGPLTPEQFAFVRAQGELAKPKVADEHASHALVWSRVMACLNPPEDENAFGGPL